VERKSHWQNIFESKASTGVSWYQPHLRASIALITQANIPRSASILDAGAGDSTLVDDLLASGFTDISVLDISPAALERVKARLGPLSKQITWIEADITQVDLASQAYDLWHDRALFHFLTHAKERNQYVSVVQHALKPGGHLIVATFSQDGPTRCSGLDTQRYNPETLSAEFGQDFTLICSLPESHQTPWGAEQKFNYCLFRKNS